MISASASGSSGASGTVAPCDRDLAATQPGVHVHGHNAQLPLLGLTVVLIGGALIQHFFGRLNVPHTVLLLIYGCALGLWVRLDPNFTLQPGMMASEHSWGGNVLQCNVTEYVPNDLNNQGWHFGNSLRALATMDPHLLLHVLLPPLLFESAFAIEWHVFAKVVGYALILAVPGLCLCTFLTGTIYVGIYGWPWEAALLLGGILSATDPVAVVALLREMGVKKSLATLIEAESLLNDGTAVVVYSILLKAVQAGGIGGRPHTTLESGTPGSPRLARLSPLTKDTGACVSVHRGVAGGGVDDRRMAHCVGRRAHVHLWPALWRRLWLCMRPLARGQCQC